MEGIRQRSVASQALRGFSPAVRGALVRPGCVDFVHALEVIHVFSTQIRICLSRDPERHHIYQLGFRCLYVGQRQCRRLSSRHPGAVMRCREHVKAWFHSPSKVTNSENDTLYYNYKLLDKGNRSELNVMFLVHVLSLQALAFESAYIDIVSPHVNGVSTRVPTGPVHLHDRRRPRQRTTTKVRRSAVGVHQRLLREDSALFDRVLRRTSEWVADDHDVRGRFVIARASLRCPIALLYGNALRELGFAGPSNIYDPCYFYFLFKFASSQKCDLCWSLACRQSGSGTDFAYRVWGEPKMLPRMHDRLRLQH